MEVYVYVDYREEKGGEINIRVPVCMEKMFPEIKYGDEPKKVKVSNITL